MRVEVSTAALKNALNLAIINSNISTYFPKTALLQVTVDGTTVRVNSEYASVVSEVCFDVESAASGDILSVFVESVRLKKIVSTITANTIGLDIEASHITIIVGGSRYTVPCIVDVAGMQFRRPSVSDEVLNNHDTIVHKNSWKFVKDHQMFALAESESIPVYRNAWIGSTGDVVVGDLINSVFTHFDGQSLGKSCLLSSNIINILNSVPDNTNIVCIGASYVLHSVSDTFSYYSEILPQYESVEVGKYNADLIISMLDSDDPNSISVETAELLKAINQSAILSDDKDSKLTVMVAKDRIAIVCDNMNSVITANGGGDELYKLDFQYNLIKSVVSNIDSTTVRIKRMVRDGNLVGLIFIGDHIRIVLAGIE